MVVSIFQSLAIAIAFAFAIAGRQRFALGAVLTIPILMLALCVATWASIELNPCERQGACHYGAGMAIPFTLLAGVVWAVAGAFGWFLGWSARRISQTSRRNQDNAP